MKPEAIKVGNWYIIDQGRRLEAWKCIAKQSGTEVILSSTGGKSGLILFDTDFIYREATSLNDEVVKLNWFKRLLGIKP